MLYHDWEAETYDDKWSISYDQRCIDYARGRFDAIVPDEMQRELPYDRALELGCGTGFFLLNLVQSGVARRGSVTDLSPGMVKVAVRNGQGLGLDIDGKVADAEGIPYDDDTFDLVVGHAVLHHIPDVELSLREVVRVLKPGGRFVFAGEPTTTGNVYARNLSTLTWRVATTVTEAAGARAAGVARRRSSTSPRARRRSRPIVDLHTFEPGDLERMATNAGAVEVRTASEEFTAAMLGWPIRTFEASVPPGRLGWGWAKFAFKSWTSLSWVDANVWRHVVPEGLVLQRDGHRGQAVLKGGGLSFTLDDVAYLGGGEGGTALAEVDGPGADRRQPDLRHRFGACAFRRPGGRPRRDDVASAQGGGQGRRRRRVGCSPREALEQATAAAVAAHRAHRLAGPRGSRRDLFGRNGTRGTGRPGRRRRRQRRRRGARRDGPAQRGR